MFKTIYWFVLSLFFVSSMGFTQEGSRDLSSTAIIDVRTPQEWQTGHLDEATLMPWQDIVSEIQTLQLNKQHAIALFCRSGNRAAKAQALLNEAGYNNVINLGSLEQAAEKLTLLIVK